MAANNCIETTSLIISRKFREDTGIGINISRKTMPDNFLLLLESLKIAMSEYDTKSILMKYIKRMVFIGTDELCESHVPSNDPPFAGAFSYIRNAHGVLM